MILADDKKRVADCLDYIKSQEDKLSDILISAIDDDEEPSPQFIKRMNELCDQYDKIKNDIQKIYNNCNSDTDKMKLYELINKVYSK